MSDPPFTGEDMTITRRSFLKGSAATAAISMVSGNPLNVIGAPSPELTKGPGNKWEGRVVFNYNKYATTICIPSTYRISEVTGWSEDIDMGWKTFTKSTMNNLVDGEAEFYTEGGLVEGAQQYLNTLSDERLCIWIMDFSSPSTATQMYQKIVAEQVRSPKQITGFDQSVAIIDDSSSEGCNVFACFGKFVIKLVFMNYADKSKAVVDAEQFSKIIKTRSSPLNVNEAIVKQMVDDSICSLADQTNVGSAWKSIFPSAFTSASKIAIKINILNNGNPAPHPYSVKAIVDGLKLMDFNGTKFSPANITIYDSNNSNSMESAGFTTTRFPGVKLVKDSTQNWGDGALSKEYASTLHDCQFLINVFSPRGHWTEFGGFTLGFKSHYGSYPPVHGDEAPAYLCDINCTGPVYNKTVLSICSGIFGMNEGNGPTGGCDDYSTYSKLIDLTSTNANPATIIMSTDPISCEMQSIKMMRLNNGKPCAISDLPNYLKASGGIEGVLTDKTYNIGIIDESKMDVRKIINGEKLTTSITPVFPRTSRTQLQLSCVQNKRQGLTTIEFHTPEALVGRNAEIEIFNLKGSKICTLSKTVQINVTHVSWNQMDLHGRIVSPGRYLIKLSIGTLSSTAQLIITR